MTVEGDKKEQELFTFYSFLNAYMIIFQIQLYPTYYFSDSNVNNLNDTFLELILFLWLTFFF